MNIRFHTPFILPILISEALYLRKEEGEVPSFSSLPGTSVQGGHVQILAKSCSVNYVYFLLSIGRGGGRWGWARGVLYCAKMSPKAFVGHS